MLDLFFGILVASAPILYGQLSKSCSTLFSVFKTRFSSHTNKNSSLQGSSKRDASITESEKTHREDGLERNFAAIPEREHDIESGDKRLFYDQHSLGNHSVQTPEPLELPKGEDR